MCAEQNATHFKIKNYLHYTQYSEVALMTRLRLYVESVKL
jgi:hypothetical protein